MAEPRLLPDSWLGRRVKAITAEVFSTAVVASNVIIHNWNVTETSVQESGSVDGEFPDGYNLSDWYLVEE